ncbi:MAG: SpoIIE family protein phosphatase, partial [Rhodothermales bacterium]|nr:SpoIIE family protein phosphatase [Rhodothermales bacterium]
MKSKRDTRAAFLNSKDFGEQLLIKDRALAASAEGITISDPSLPDNPLIYANEGFERLTGYSVEDVVGRNCRFLQGPDTDPDTVDVIREAIRTDTACTVQILNYRKDGTPFWNRLSITPIKDAAGTVTNHIGIQSDVTAQKDAEDALQEAKRELESANERMRKDLEAAAKIQQALLPERPPEIAGLNVSWAFRPCQELAGDVLSVFPINRDLVALYILDVSGHGVGASLLSVAVSRMLSPAPGRSVVFEDGRGSRVATPARVAARLNKFFPFDTRTAQYFTLVYGLLDLKASKFRYVAAGHPPPVVLSKDAAPVTLETTGPPIGLLPSATYEDREIELVSGNRVVLYTDGIVEAENGDGTDFGDKRFT